MKWKKLNVIGPECEINEYGTIRQKINRVKGRIVKDQIRKPSVDLNGFLYINFQDSDGNQIGKKVHRLVAENFIPNPYKHKYVRHRDIIKTNNRVINLYWTNRKPVGERVFKLTREKVTKIKSMIREGLPNWYIADKMGVGPSLISHIKARRRWK